MYKPKLSAGLYPKLKLVIYFPAKSPGTTYLTPEVNLKFLAKFHSSWINTEFSLILFFPSRYTSL